MFKVIGPRQGLRAKVRDVLSVLGYGEAALTERLSSSGRHLSLTFELDVASGERLDHIYCALEKIDGAAYVL
jgi:putative lipoic acid-binding regulatory protein